jgi:adenine-specific DNA-methyltransferase
MAKKKTNGDASKAKPAAKKAASTAAVEAVKHQDRRTNIPTREQGAMVATDEAAPKSVLYPRDPSLDPQLVWTGKDEQDRRPLEVPAVPIYIQEKVHPQALIEELRIRAAANRPPDANLFADFNGLDGDPAKRTDFYHHEHQWTKRLILGDSLLVMTSLAEKERLKGKVQCVYIDPPYGIKFGSNWQVSTRRRDVKDAKAEDLTRQPEQIRAFRDTWELGIHSYLTYLRDRLTVARDLLTESGSIFVQIGDTNLHLVRSLLDEVFGSDNNVSFITFKKTTNATGDFLPGTTDFLLWYAKDCDAAKRRFRELFKDKVVGEAGSAGYSWLELSDRLRRRMTSEEAKGSTTAPTGSRVFQLDNLTSQSAGREKGEGASS